MGIAALVLGIVGLVCCFGELILPSVLAIIFGFLGRKKASEGLATNGGMALAGLIMGIVGVVLGIGFWVIALANGGSYDYYWNANQ